jgi:hypothetical protein
MEPQTMADSSLNKPTLETDRLAVEPRKKAERRQLLWRFLFSFGLIASTVAVATMIAHWTRPIL